jgi:hypothetical protein
MVSGTAQISHRVCQFCLSSFACDVVSAGKLRKLWDSLSELRSSLCERRLEMTAPSLRYCLSKLRNLLVFFPPVRYDVTH